MFITLEGPEGSGKTSQIIPLAEFLRQQGYTVITTREPGGTAIGDQIRTTLMDLRNAGMNPRTEILLFLAARAQFVDEVVRPALKEGKVILSDRYADSTLAYQGYGHGIDLGILRQMLDFCTGGLRPDLTVLLDVDPIVGLRRRLNSGGEWNRLDAYPAEFHERVRRGYHDLVKEEPQRWEIVDASLAPNKVQQALRDVILNRLKKSITPKL